MAAVGSAAVVLACVVGLLSLAPGSPADRPDALPPPRSVDQVEAARAAVRDRPRDALAWSQLGQAETEQARTTLDAAQLDRAEQAFGRSLALRPKDNYDAVAGSGTLANARHEFTAARQFGRRATEMAPGRPAGYAVLADAHIQLGEYPAATAAAQRLLDLAPTGPPPTPGPRTTWRPTGGRRRPRSRCGAGWRQRTARPCRRDTPVRKPHVRPVVMSLLVTARARRLARSVTCG
ncbi:tetratricopeptide repeat protein [Streptomyces umbrinus]|uniref:tetratricopeptide repeat protein n=1 Tax=Streptomyces umbrinus TaxID=67370 RepID=UPI0034081DD7